jgi:hypothetical protein
MCPWQRRPEVARKENKLPVNRVYLKRIAPYTNLLTRSRWWRSMSRRDARLPSLRCSAWATTRSIDRLLRPRYISWWLMYNDTSAMNTCILFWAVINTWMLIWLSHRLFCSFVYIMLIYISSQKFTLIQGLARTSASSHAWVRIRRYRWTSASVASTWNSFPHLTWLEASVTLLSSTSPDDNYSSNPIKQRTYYCPASIHWTLTYDPCEDRWIYGSFWSSVGHRSIAWGERKAARTEIQSTPPESPQISAGVVGMERDRSGAHFSTAVPPGLLCTVRPSRRKKKNSSYSVALDYT